jgi:hypothetical protein
MVLLSHPDAPKIFKAYWDKHFEDWRKNLPNEQQAEMTEAS